MKVAGGRAAIRLLARALPIIVSVAIASTGVAPGLTAQQVSWPTTHQQALWVTTSVKHEFSARTALWFDGSWRRMGIGEEPQQTLLRPGIIRTLAPGVRVGPAIPTWRPRPTADCPPRPPRESIGCGRTSGSRRATGP